MSPAGSSANVYAQTLGSIFTEQAKPYEVELCVAEVAHYGETKPPELYRITYDGSIADEPHFVVMGGTTERITNALKESYTENADLPDALKIAVEALRANNSDNSQLTASRASRWPAWRRRFGRQPAAARIPPAQPSRVGIATAGSGFRRLRGPGNSKRTRSPRIQRRLLQLRSSTLNYVRQTYGR